MPFFKAKYERCNFDFSEKVEQTFDVVFEVDEEEPNEENRKKFDNACHEAAAKQIPKVDHHNTGLPLGGGWSSVMGGHKYTRLHLPWGKWKIQIPSEGKPVVCCLFSTPDSCEYDGTPRRYRATSFYKIVKWTPKPDPILDKIMPEMRLPRWKLFQCIPKEAHVISGCGVAGCIELIKKVTVGDLVKWPENTIKRDQYEYVKQVKKMTENDQLFVSYDLNSYATKWAAELGMTL